MSRRLKVLMSAYACEPSKGSEPEVGWQWAMQMARFHDVTVLTRENNRDGIESEIARLGGARAVPKFIYFDRSPFLLDIKRRSGSIQFYYLLWQRKAWEVIHRLAAREQFDLIHHVTFAAFRYPAAIWGHGLPTIWGPIGGIESIRFSLLPWTHPRSLAHEAARNLSNLIQKTPYHVLPRRAAATTLILASTREMQAALKVLHHESRLMPAIGLRTADFPLLKQGSGSGPLKLLFVGNIITLKGIDLALKALAMSGTNASLTLVGSGNYQAAAERLAEKLGLSSRVTFAGRMERSEVLGLYKDFDVFIFPSLHDTGGYAVIEAMVNGLPVICLDCGGPAVALGDGCGVRVPVGSPASVISGLARAIRGYSEAPAKLAEHGRNARQAVIENYDWDRKGEAMSKCYAQAMERSKIEPVGKARNFRGSGSITNFALRLFSYKGALVSFIALLLIGTLGFLSINYLRKQAETIVNDTLPGLSYSGEINANLAQAFNRTLLLLQTDDRKEKAELSKEVQHFSAITSRYLAQYRESIFTPDDQALYERILEVRKKYLKSRERVIQLSTGNSRQAAAAMCRTELLPAYQAYKSAADKLFEFNINQGRARGREIMAVCTATQFLVAAVVVVIFVLGFLVGLSR
jgi:glycosyltransferase involved in cell wall biosynthesis